MTTRGRGPTWPTTASRPGTSLYCRIADQLVTAIEQGDYRPGSRLPSEARLVRELGVSQGPSATRSPHSSVAA